MSITIIEFYFSKIIELQLICDFYSAYHTLYLLDFDTPESRKTIYAYPFYFDGKKYKQ